MVGLSVEDALNTCVDGFLSLDREFRVVFPNRAALRLFGTGTDRLFRLPVWEILDGVDPLLVREALQRGDEFRCQASVRGSHSVAIRIVPTKPGAAVWLSLIAPSVPNEPIDLIEAASLGTWSWDLFENRLIWSRRCMELFGFDPDTPMTIDRFYASLHPDDVALVREAIDAALADAGTRFDVDYRVVWPDGSVHWIHSWGRASAGPDGKSRRMDGVASAIDERKAVEQELQNTTEILRAIIDGSPLAIVRTDAAGRVTVWNAGAEKTLGYSAASLMGKPCPLVIEQTGEVQHRELRVARADGAECEIICSTAPLLGPRGESGGHVLMFSDITERNRVKRNTEHIEKLDSLGVLAGGVAHDFNNLLTGIMGNASLGLETLDVDSDVRPLLHEIVHSSERATSLTRQLLAYAGKGRFDTSTLDLTSLARETVRIANEGIPHPRQRVRTGLQSGPIEVEVDRGQLQQAILNLIANAVEAMKDGDGPAGSIRVTTRVEEILQPVLSAEEFGEALSPGRYAILEVSDTGVGMDETTRARIFEPFFSTKFTGRGLGLPSVLGIVRRHRGALNVESTPGVGSTFRVMLPLAHQQVSETARRPTPSRDLRGEGLILVVDDEDTVRNTVRRALERLNYRVIMAEHGQAAVEAFRRYASEVRAIILDLTMPVMGGEEALEHLRRLKPEVPVILTSGYSAAEAMRRMEGKGIGTFLQKPFTAEQVGRALSDLLNRGDGPESRRVTTSTPV